MESDFFWMICVPAHVISVTVPSHALCQHHQIFFSERCASRASLRSQKTLCEPKLGRYFIKEGIGLWEYKALVITGKLMMIFTLNIFMSVNNNNFLYLTMFLSQSTTVGRNCLQCSNNKIPFLRNYQNTGCCFSPAGHSLVLQKSLCFSLNHLVTQEEAEFVTLRLPGGHWGQGATSTHAHPSHVIFRKKDVFIPRFWNAFFQYNKVSPDHRMSLKLILHRSMGFSLPC